VTLPKFSVPQTDGDIEIKYYDSVLIKERKWPIAKGQVEVEDEDREFFQNHVEGATLVEAYEPEGDLKPGAADASDSKPEETTPVPRKR
jgi:hypothetical protein